MVRASTRRRSEPLFGPGIVRTLKPAPPGALASGGFVMWIPLRPGSLREGELLGQIRKLDREAGLAYRARRWSDWLDLAGRIRALNCELMTIRRARRRGGLDAGQPRLL